MFKKPYLTIIIHRKHQVYLEINIPGQYQNLKIYLIHSVGFSQILSTGDESDPPPSKRLFYATIFSIQLAVSWEANFCMNLIIIIIIVTETNLRKTNTVMQQNILLGKQVSHFKLHQPQYSTIFYNSQLKLSWNSCPTSHLKQNSIEEARGTIAKCIRFLCFNFDFS